LNELLEAERLDEFVETRCAKFYAEKLLIGYFEGIGAERGIAWRLADSLGLCSLFTATTLGARRRLS